MKKKCTVVLENEKFVLDLSLNIDKNIQKLYNEKKKYDDKRTKTIEAMKNLSIKYEPKKKLEPQKREKYWFEKFNYFISKDRDETVLILGGMNAAQNDVIYNKYLQIDDIYLHCNVQGASSIIIKDTCKMKEEIKDKVMKEASYMALVMSKCCKEQTLSNVIWVQGNQVTKTIDNKTSPVGGFFLTGKQSFLYPPRIEYRIAIVFKIKDKSELYYETDVSDPVTIKHAMPINGPWCTLKSYKYSLRLCPGNLKKQKLAQSILGIFNKKCKDQTEEHFVNLIGLSEYMDIVLSKSRLSK
ncbi:NEMF [Hepatospora eriocheir]|uniref:NEMF n=1 Tax=Hepatospora eriocheir TaxID=1081669 RepID=A0A1X0Q7P3_9MICR|nr:NEMF [Hepatospora eriocheir]